MRARVRFLYVRSQSCRQVDCWPASLPPSGPWSRRGSRRPRPSLRQRRAILPLTSRERASGRLLSILDSRGKGVTLSYDVAGLSRVTDAGGRQLEIELKDGRLSRLELPDGRELRYRYSNNRLTGVHSVRRSEWRG